MQSTGRHTDTLARIRAEVPHSAGVYLFYDRHGRIIYIGKSVDLRRRMTDYFRSHTPDRDTRKQEMIFNIASFSFRDTGSELLALLLEDVLIKRHLPDYNTRQREFTEYVYLNITGDPYPACLIVNPGDTRREGTLFGPFRDRYAADKLVQLIRHFLNLRTCTDPDPFRKSANYEMGLCRGPCRGLVTREDYATVVNEVTEFLEGDARLITRRIDRAMEQAAANQAYENAGKYRENIAFCDRFCRRQRFVRRFRDKRTVTENAAGEAVIFERGTVIDAAGGPGDVIAELKGDNIGDGDQRIVLDRAEIVYNWLRRKNTQNTVRFESHRM
jgi:excinuclease ABC subunit C